MEEHHLLKDYFPVQNNASIQSQSFGIGTDRGSLLLLNN
jgi:hypothetical protein